MERERRGLFGVESNATLPADWKHHEPRKESGLFGFFCICVIHIQGGIASRLIHSSEQKEWINIYELTRQFDFPDHSYNLFDLLLAANF